MPQERTQKRTKAKDRVGHRYGRLLVEAIAGRRHGHVLMQCLCDCGNRVFVEANNLPRTMSCGCRKSEVNVLRNRTHGCSGCREWSIWKDMLRRCRNPQQRAFRWYGNRGIKVCERWKNSFRAFLDDMGEAPSQKHGVERIDNNGDYEPTNCRWATQREQMRNTTRTIRLTVRGETKTLCEWAELFNVPAKRVRTRIRSYGWSAEEALTIPPDPSGKLKRGWANGKETNLATPDLS